MLALAALLAVAHVSALQPRPIPIVLDTDIGGDIDDAFALALVLGSPELDLRAVTTVSGDTQARARMAAKLLSEAGRRDVPVAAGAMGKKLDTSQAVWAEGFTSPALRSEKAIDLMKTEIDRGHGETVLVAIGPLTNIAALLNQHPEEKKKIKRIVLMGGSIARGYYPNSGRTTEYNIAADAAASQVVFTSGVPILMAPLDVTAQLQVEAPQRQRLFAQSRPVIEALHQLYVLWAKATPDLQGIPTLHDPMALSLLIDPGLCVVKPMAIEIDAQGLTLASATGRPNATVAVETDPARFIDFYLRRVAP
jgi:inosine-uridine nucleoside N-ribohydrolase